MRLRHAGLAALLGLVLAPAAARAELIGTCGNELCVATDAGAVTVLTSDGASNAYSTPSASTDGSRITYTRANGLYRAGLRNAAPENLFETDRGKDAATSQDGQSFAFRTFDFRVGPTTSYFESNLRIGGAVGSALWANSTRVDYAAFVSNRLVITQPDGGTLPVGCFVAVIPSEQAPPCAEKVAVDPARSVGRMAATPDGKLVAAEATTDDGSSGTQDPSVIALYDAAAGGVLVRDLSAGPADFDPSVSPDGSQVAFTRGSDTWVVPTAGGAPRLLVTGMVNASWYETPPAPGGGGTPTPPGGPGTPGGPTVTGRPAAPAARLKAKGRRLTLKVRCTATTGCAKTRWTFKQGKTVRLRVTVPALKAGAKRTLKVKLSKATARRIGKRGLKLRLTGKGLKARTVRIVRA